MVIFTKIIIIFQKLFSQCMQINFRQVIFVQTFGKTTLYTLTSRAKTLICVTNKYSIDNLATTEQSQISRL